MNHENFKMLQEMYEELIHQQLDLQQRMEDNRFKIEELESYYNSFFEKEDKDFNFLSPRNVETVHKYEIEKIKSEMLFYQNENKDLSFVFKNLQERIDRFEKILIEETEQSEKLFKTLEEEHYRISRDLHDTSLQNLTYLVHKIELCGMFVDNDPLRAKLELSVVNKNLRTIIDEIRNTIFNLRPMEFDDLGLKAAFERLLEIINADNRYEIDFDVDDVSCENNDTLLILYRVVQECLNNIVKHAEASKIILHGRNMGEIYSILIADDGKGFSDKNIEEKHKNHFGMSLIKERIDILQGFIDIHTCDKGTKIEIKIPLQNDLIR